MGPAQGGKGGGGKGKRTWLIAAVAALVVALIGGGGVYAASLLSGGGTQPHEVLPQTAIGYLRLDLDPAANQKLALFGIARKFTVTKDTFTGEDPRKALFESLKKDDSDLAKLDYAKDVEPWLGSRIGVAALPPAQGSDEPTPVIAVQVTDQEAARAGIEKLMAGDKYGIAFREDYALLAESQQTVDQSVSSPTLADNADFTGDIGAVGEQGVLSFWMNVEQVGKLAGQLDGSEQEVLKQLAGTRMAGALRFDSQYVELAGLLRGAKDLMPAESEAARVADLPASTLGAVSISGLGDMFTKQWPKYQSMLASTPSFQQMLTAAQQSGVALPDDVATLLGKNLTVAVDENGLDNGQPKIGARIVTDTAKAQGIVSKIEQLLSAQGGNLPQLGKATGDGVMILASTQEYAQQLAQAGTLGDSESFKLAVPDAGAAGFAIYVDLDKAERLYLPTLQGEDQANAKVLRAVGLSGKSTAEEATFSLRVLFN
ncbi:DUF3352 domain-containing protein [Spongiactinospora rosea]|nr:DUF3352 domain-containing protein [Spongiactinospora rosea]